MDFHCYTISPAANNKEKVEKDEEEITPTKNKQKPFCLSF